MLDTLEEENTYVREPILKGEREENPEVSIMQEKKQIHEEELSNRRDEFWPEVWRTSFKEDRGQRAGP